MFFVKWEIMPHYFCMWELTPLKAQHLQLPSGTYPYLMVSRGILIKVLCLSQHAAGRNIAMNTIPADTTHKSSVIQRRSARRDGESLLAVSARMDYSSNLPAVLKSESLQKER